ncbi:MAG: hypothetical protein ACP5R2_14755 [Anaerolineae bacterium]
MGLAQEGARLIPENVFPLPWYTSLGAVALLSLLLTSYELFKIFQRDFGRTLRNRYALILFLLNVVVAVSVWLFVHRLLAVQPTILTTLAVGLTFPALLRSRFTIYRTIAPSTSNGEQKSAVDEISLKMDEMYHSLQSAFYKEIDLELARERAALNKQLRETFSAVQIEERLADIILSITIDADREQWQEKLTKIQAIADDSMRHRQLANLLIQLSERDDLKRAIRERTLTPLP